MTCKTCFRCISLLWPAGAARCGLPQNQEVDNGAGQPVQAPLRTTRKLRRGRTVAETSRFLTTQGLGGPEGEAAESGFARRTQGPRPQSDAPGSGPAGPEIFWVLLYLYKSTSPGGEISPRPIPVPPAGDIIRGRRPQGAALRAGRPEAAPLRSPMAACVQGAAGPIPPVRGKCPEGTKGVGINSRYGGPRGCPTNSNVPARFWAAQSAAPPPHPSRLRRATFPGGEG